jgi:hypothetical protein
LLSMKLGPDDLKNKNNESDGSTDW